LSKKICVVGLGYIGLPTAVMLAKSGYSVIGVDININKINNIKNKNIDTNENNLKEYLEEVIDSKKLIAQRDVVESDVYILCVPTPIVEKEGKKKCDLSCVISAVDSIKPHLKDGDLLIIESTVPPNTTEEIYKKLKKDGKNIYMAYCPERVLPGKIIEELVYNDRIIGGVDKKSSELAMEIYKSFVKGNIYLTDCKTAEMVKLMENIYRDVNISLANEFAKICNDININVWEAIDLANKHPRVNILKPGPGVGGHCISVDPWFIISNENIKKENCKLIKTGREINDSMPKYVANIVVEELKYYNIKNPKIGIMGITYKGNVDDTRESPAKSVIDNLIKKGCNIKLYDPYSKVFDYPLDSFEETIKDSDALLFLTDHKVFNNYDEDTLRYIFNLMRNKIVIDTKNIIDRNLWEKVGFTVKLLGNGRDWNIFNCQKKE